VASRPSSLAEAEAETETVLADPARASVNPAIKAAGVWLHMFARTLKTCRLYDAGNPTVLRFREELVEALTELLTRHGAVTFRFTAEEVSCEGQALYTARSREDNLAFAFYRDGVRGLTIQPGADARECHAVVDAVLNVTGQNLDGDDLVTLLWEANLRHVDVDYIPAEGETGAGDSAPGAPEDGAGALLPWPTADGGPAAGQDAGGDGSRSASDIPTGAERSEDWALGELTEEVEATFAELDFMSAQEVRRFTFEYEAERRVPPRQSFRTRAASRRHRQHPRNFRNARPGPLHAHIRCFHRAMARISSSRRPFHAFFHSAPRCNGNRRFSQA